MTYNKEQILKAIGTPRGMVLVTMSGNAPFFHVEIILHNQVVLREDYYEEQDAIERVGKCV